MMNKKIELAIKDLCVHAWGTSEMNSPDILSDALIMLEHRESIDLNVLHKVLIKDLQSVNLAYRMQNPDEVQPPFVSMELTYAVSKINCLLLDTLQKVDPKWTAKLTDIARDFAAAWYCFPSCDIENVEERF